MDTINDFNNLLGDRLTPSEILTYARSKYNAAGDLFFTDAELYYLIYQAQLELSVEMPGIVEAIYTTTTTAGTNAYAFPTPTRVIRRIEYINLSGSAQKLEPITWREDDALTLVNVASTTQGTPTFYTTYNYTMYLRPTPDTSACTIKVYSYNEPQVVTATSVLDIPTPFHMDICDFMVMHMYLKDKDPRMAKCYADLWQAGKSRAKRWVQKKKRGDAFTVVMNEDNLAVTLSGPV